MFNYWTKLNVHVAAVILLFIPFDTIAQEGITHQVSIAANSAYSFKSNGPSDSDYGFQLSVSEIHHLTKNIGFEFGLAYDFVQTQHSELQIDAQAYNRYSLSKLRFNAIAAPLNLRYYFNESFSLFTGYLPGYAFSDVTKVYDVRHRHDEVMDDSHKTLMTTLKGKYKKSLTNAYQLGFSYGTDVRKYFLYYGFEYALYSKHFDYDYINHSYSYNISRFTMRVGIWR
jgi:long-subunit fatty acid transport protein